MEIVWQKRSVRLYAHEDYVKKIRSHGFRVEDLGKNISARMFFARSDLSEQVFFMWSASSAHDLAKLTATSKGN